MLESDADMIWLIVAVSVTAGLLIGLLVGRAWRK
jgi:hypothetical protein